MFLVELETNPVKIGLRDVHYPEKDSDTARLVARMENASGGEKVVLTLRDGAADIAARVGRRSRLMGRISMLTEAELPKCELAVAMRSAIADEFGEVVTTTPWADSLSEEEAKDIVERLK